MQTSIDSSSSNALTAILKLARELDESADQDELLSRFASMVIQTTLAERVALLLHDDDFDCKVRVFATSESTQLLNQPVKNNAQLPTQLIEYAKITANIVHAGTQYESPVFDSYLSANPLSSVICLPVMIRNRVSAVLYLDHSTKEQHFDCNCISALNFLCYHAVNYLQASAPGREPKLQFKPEKEQIGDDITLPHRVIETVPVMIYHHIYEPDGSTFYTAYVNSKCKEMYGIEKNVAINNGQALRKWVHPDDIKNLQKKVLLSVQRLEPYSAEYRVAIPGQRVRWHQSTGHPTLLESGHVSMAGVSRDITDQKVAELALQESQLQFQRMSENVPGMIYRIVLRPDGTQFIDYVSSQVRDFYEIEPEEVIADITKVFSVIHPLDIDKIHDAINLSAEQLSTYSEEYRVVLPKQGLRWRQTLAQPQRLENGNIVWDAVTIDKTEEKAAEHKLLETQRQLQRISENVPGMIYRYVVHADGQHEITHASSQCLDIFEVRHDEALGPIQNLFCNVHKDDMQKFLAAIEKSAEELNRLQVEYRVMLPQQGMRWRQSIAHPRRDASGSTIWDSVAIDITQHKHAESKLQFANKQLAKATKMKDEFIANMSHELRTPLTAILSTNEVIQMGYFGPVTDEQSDGCKVIQDSGAHLLELINEVLDLAKIESGLITLEYSYTQISQLCESSLQLLKQQAKQKNIKLDLRLAHNLPLLHADEKRVRQILVNLLSNAVKFTADSGKVVLEVQCIDHETTAKSQKNSHGRVRFIVTDTGIGIDESRFESLFEPFVQLNTSLNRDYGGTGLGLSLVKLFTELHGGSIEISSTVGKGSCFSVDLPIQKINQIPDNIEWPDEHISQDNSVQTTLPTKTPIY